MNTPLSWIKAYVPELDCTVQEYADAMTLSGTKVEDYINLDQNLDRIIVGKISKIEQHPDADKLVVCQVQISESGDEVQIVTGAKNVKEGQKIPVVMDGGRVATDHSGNIVPGGTKIKKGKLRGVTSNGMLCSVQELGFDTDRYPDAEEDGIFILSDSENFKDAPIGADAIELFGLRDTVFEYEVTSNRVDCFAVLGIAREAAATFSKPFLPPEIKEVGNHEKASDYIEVEIKNDDLCSRFIARAIKNIKLAPSPEWMQRRLSASGIRPINNIVDITNYVMEEYGQPMHAYDLDTIEDRKIVVRTAGDGEEFISLDGNKRVLDSSMLMICDGKKPIGIAGIMGGENSMITGNIKDMLLEAACFNGTNIRLSGKKLGMRTDAQSKFEKGLDPNNTMQAMNRACQLIEELGAGEVVGGAVDVYPQRREEITVAYDADKINRLLGTDLDEEEMILYFERIGLTVDRKKKRATIPTGRPDIQCMADLAEEVARFYGYDNIPVTLPVGEATVGKLSEDAEVKKIIGKTVEQAGFSESMTFSFESPKVYDKLNLEEGDRVRENIMIANPLGEDYSIMRTLSLNGMLTSLATNYNRRNQKVRLYEMARVYLPKSLPLTELPDERLQLTLGMYQAGDFFDIKGVTETVLDQLGITEIPEYDPSCNRPYLHPGRKADIKIGKNVIGFVGEVHPDVCENYDIGTKAYIAVMDVKELTDRADFSKRFQGLAKYPAITRDISLVMNKEISAGSIEQIIRENGGKLLEAYSLFDIYEGEQLNPDEKSLAYTIRFRAPDRT
ncbi:MAG: phenylalanine--tRNA ligase subunit beta, partial [Lachnoclostridium sp.]|nr:phenylalanine--tRNA ligase subunit beta [Lachnoclostridium sp.]